jgi:NADH dehydrogenase [ubiquinone] 1 alpha subcomplex assembly factor 1
VAEHRYLYRFEDPAEITEWQPVDDVVMGGVSSSRLSPGPQHTAVFSGVLSLAHGGGFASVRSTPRHVGLSAFEGLEIRVRGDGKRYRLRLRTEPGSDGIAYQARFDTDLGNWQTLRFPFDAFSPTYRGRAVPEAPALDAGQVHSFGFLIGDKQAGPFNLEIDWLRAYGPPADRD